MIVNRWAWPTVKICRLSKTDITNDSNPIAMRTLKKLSMALFVWLISVCYTNVQAQSCKQAFYSAKEQYNGGQFVSAQNLLNDCINSFDTNSDPDEVYQVYKLYIASCLENRDNACADTKRQQLMRLFSNTDAADVLQRLEQTKF